jgi:hypothetical protein
MTLSEKVEEALALLREKIPLHAKPVVFASFGKDSLVTLDLVKKAGFKLPVLFCREPFFPEKYAFANSVILHEGLSVYDYPPSFTGIAYKNGKVEIINYHQIKDNFLILPTGIVPPEVGKEFLCALGDLYLKPTGTFNFPWDMAILGHKNSDVDPMWGPAPLKESYVASSVVPITFPLFNFTDADVWDYHALYDIPVHDLRYDKENGYREFADKTHNPDYFPTCTACMIPGEAEVFCPKISKMIPNISSHLRWVDKIYGDYIRVSEH